MLFNKYRFIWLFIYSSILGSVVLSGCQNDTRKSTQYYSAPHLKISIYQGDVEAPIGTIVRFAGYLISAANDTLDKEKVYFSAHPDSLGNMSPIGGAFTDINNLAGLSQDVIFTGIKEGMVTILGVYRDSQGLRVAADSVEIRVIGSING